MTRRRFALGAILLVTVVITLTLCQPSSPPPVSPLALSPLDGPVPEPEPIDAHFVYLPFVARNWDGNLLRNPSFEQGYGGGCLWADYTDDTWNTFCYNEQQPPKDWTGGWIHQEPCYNDYVTGLPEMRLAERWVDPIRVFEGDYAAQAFTFWRCGFWWWQQTVSLSPGEYQGSAYIQTWDDGTWAHICLADYCGPWFTSPNEYLKISTPVMELSGPVVFRVEFKAPLPRRNTDGYLDNTRLERK